MSNDQIQREIEGNQSLAEINDTIGDEELGASEFKGSKVSTVNNKPTNIVTFSKLPPGKIPNKLTVVKDGTAQPAGTQKVWSGTMVVSGTITAVVGYRAT